MTKKELLQDLESRPFIKKVAGDPVLREQKPDGTCWYTVNVAETFQKAAVYKNVDFYVFDEDTEDEAAYYKDRDPRRDVSPTGFRETLSQKLIDDPEVTAWVYRHTDEFYRMGVIEALSPDSEDPEGALVPTLFLCWLEGSEADPTLNKKPINVSTEIIARTSIIGG